MIENEAKTAGVKQPGRPWYVPDVVLLSMLVGIHAVLFALLHVVASLTEKDPGSGVMLAVMLVLATLVLSLRLAIRMTRVALLSALLVVYVTFFAVRHVIAYLMGSMRDLSLLWIILFMVLALLTLVLSLGLVIRMIWPWPGRIRDLGRHTALCLLATVGIVVFLVLPFTRFGWPPYKTSTRAFRDYAHAKVDLDAMRAWLNTLDGKYDPNYEYELVYAPIEARWPEAAPWAKTITRWHPDSVRLALDHDNHPVIRIAGLHGHSLVVGSESMQTPPADFLKRDKYRLSLGPGAYVANGK
jgi:hypothetical protein